MTPVIPVSLFAYARPEHLQRTLASLRENHVPLIYAFVDGPKNSQIEPLVHEVRNTLRQVDWCDIRLVERECNLGLGASILAGVRETLEKHEEVIVFEDDLICVPGTYEYLCAALEAYRNESRVMSVTGWTHPLSTPSGITDQPYFDGRAECWVWGTWRRAWQGMEEGALSLLQKCEEQGIDIYRYGADLVEMAKKEQAMNIWAVRFSYLHILKGGLCLRPPFSLVQHIGYDPQSVHLKNAAANKWHVELPSACSLIPSQWPPAIEDPACSSLWQRECGRSPTMFSMSVIFLENLFQLLRLQAKKLLKLVKPRIF
jgi:hypothetical protein